MPPSLPSPPEAVGWQVGRSPTAPVGSFLGAAPACTPHPGQLSHKWESSWRPGQTGACILRRMVSVLASPSLCTGPLPPACCLESQTGSSFQPPLPLQPRPHGAWRWSDGWPHVCSPVIPILACAGTSIPTPSCHMSNHRGLSKAQVWAQGLAPREVGNAGGGVASAPSIFLPSVRSLHIDSQASCMGL